jgi:3',5'-cyclic AMP phosphodiesterase CpdA
MRLLANKRILGYLSWRRRRRKVHRKEVLDAVVADIRSYAPDHIAITGDLTHVGLPVECSAALHWLRSVGRSDWVSVVPGNHDRYVADRFDYTVGRWREYFRSDGGQAKFPFFRRRGRVALIGVDTAVPTPPFLASGTVGDAQRERLAGLLTEAGSAGLFRIVLLHHSPLPDGHAQRKRLTDATELTQLLTTLGAELVIHGHGHEARIDRLTGPAGPMLVIAVPSASNRTVGQAGWNRYSISGNPGHWRLDVETRRTVFEGLTTTSRGTLSWDEPEGRASTAGPRKHG